jgi:hypothetical protein
VVVVVPARVVVVVVVVVFVVATAALCGRPTRSCPVMPLETHRERPLECYLKVIMQSQPQSRSY